MSFSPHAQSLVAGPKAAVAWQETVASKSSSAQWALLVFLGTCVGVDEVASESAQQFR